jgi:hypothetical protein
LNHQKLDQLLYRPEKLADSREEVPSSSPEPVLTGTDQCTFKFSDRFIVSLFATASHPCRTYHPEQSTTDHQVLQM